MKIVLKLTGIRDSATCYAKGYTTSSANLQSKRDGFQFPVRFQVPLHEQVAGDTWPEAQFCSARCFRREQWFGRCSFPEAAASLAVLCRLDRSCRSCRSSCTPALVMKTENIASHGRGLVPAPSGLPARAGRESEWQLCKMPGVKW